MMRRLPFLLATLFGLCTIAFSQEHPRVEEASGDESFVISLSLPIELDGMDVTAILKQRTNQVHKYDFLVPTNYAPNPAIFSGLSQEHPFWGLYGMVGRRVAEGPSLDSVGLLNPYLLVLPFLWWDGPQWQEVRNEEFENYRRAEQEFSQEFFHRTRLTCMPKRYACVYSIPASLVMERAQQRVRKQDIAAIKFENLRLSLITYNAQDFGFSWGRINWERSHGIESSRGDSPIFPFEQRFQVSPYCRYPAGCNDLAKWNDTALKSARLKGLPASLVIDLFNSKPESITPPAWSYELAFQ